MRVPMTTSRKNTILNDVKIQGNLRCKPSQMGNIILYRQIASHFKGHWKVDFYLEIDIHISYIT